MNETETVVATGEAGAGMARQYLAAFSQLEMSRRFSQTQIESLYAWGARQFSQGQFEQARRAFTVLALYKPMDADICHAAGLCELRLGHLPDALAALTLAQQLEPKRLEIGLDVVDCLLRLGQREGAAALLYLLAQAARDAGNEPVVEVANARLELLLSGLRADAQAQVDAATPAAPAAPVA